MSDPLGHLRRYRARHKPPRDASPNLGTQERGPRWLPSVSVRELSRDTRRLLDRVARGERLIICRHDQPIATLQPLDGVVVQPFDGHEYDVFGAPLGDAFHEARKLPDLARALLRDGVTRLGKVSPLRIRGRYRQQTMGHVIEQLIQMGLLIRTDRGLEPTSRGWMLRDALVAQAGQSRDDAPITRVTRPS